MSRLIQILIISATIILSIAAQAQTSAQAGAQANGGASLQADETHAQASSGVSASSFASSQSNQTNAGLSSGTAFNATLNTPVDSKKSQPGDAVTARTAESVKSDGKTVLPKGTKLVGHVTHASARARGNSESALAIIFDRAILRNGQEVPLNVAIQAIASPQTTASAVDADVDTMGSAGASAAGSGMARSRGAVGGLASTAGATAGSLINTATTVGSTGGATLDSAVTSTTGVAGASRGAGGVNAAGQLTSDSRGVFSMNGLSLDSVATNNTQGSMITSTGKSVHLDNGTRMLMVTEASASATPNR
jgi:hypothetical protein